MVRIPLDLAGLDLKATFIIVGGWGIFLLALGVFFLLRSYAKKLNEQKVVKWQRNWERRRGQRRSIRDFATLFLKASQRLSSASYPFAVLALAVLVFISIAFFRLISIETSLVWAFAVVEVGFFIPAYLSIKMVSGGLRSVGEKISTLAADLEKP